MVLTGPITLEEQIFLVTPKDRVPWTRPVPSAHRCKVTPWKNGNSGEADLTDGGTWWVHNNYYGLNTRDRATWHNTHAVITDALYRNLVYDKYDWPVYNGCEVNITSKWKQDNCRHAVPDNSELCLTCLTSYQSSAFWKLHFCRMRLRHLWQVSQRKRAYCRGLISPSQRTCIALTA